MANQDVLGRLRGGLIVSCQAREGSPVYGPTFMAAFARCAELGGAVGLRVDGADDVRACRAATRLPIIGINKQREDAWPVYITPDLESARQVVDAGAQIVAIDATHRPRRSGLSPDELIRSIQQGLGVLVMADVDSLDEGLAAAAAGADLVATTMAGYTGARAPTEGPDLELLSALARRVDVPVICEGRVRAPSDLAAAFAAGAYAVVVGTAITNPIAITESFARAAANAPGRR
jgi:putative N-acetylmannosamine-6-phosphate epimerase